MKRKSQLALKSQGQLSDPRVNIQPLPDCTALCSYQTGLQMFPYLNLRTQSCFLCWPPFISLQLILTQAVWNVCPPISRSMVNSTTGYSEIRIQIQA